MTKDERGNVFTFPPPGGGSRGSSGGGGDGIHIALLTPYIDAKMDVVRAELKSDMDNKVQALSAKLDSLPQTATVWKAVGTLSLVIFGSVGAIFGILAYTGDRVDGGIAAAGIYQQEMLEAKQRDAQQAQSLSEISQQIDKISSQRQKK
jgi:hypothetical protein